MMKILSVFAHLDDAEFWAGGTLLKHASRGDEIITIVEADSGNIKIEESQTAHAIMGGKLIIIDELNKQSIEDKITEFLPDIMLTHRSDDSNPEHRKIFEIVTNAVLMPWIYNQVPKRLLSVDSYSSRGFNGIFEPTAYINISEVWDQKKQLISCFKSEPFVMWQNMIEGQNRFWGEGVGKAFCEVFKEVPIQGKLTSNEYL